MTHVLSLSRQKLLHSAHLSFVTNYSVEDHALIIPRAKHYSNINEGTNIYITPSPSVRRLALARSLENGQRQQVGEGGTNGREQTACKRPPSRPAPDARPRMALHCVHKWRGSRITYLSGHRERCVGVLELYERVPVKRLKSNYNLVSVCKLRGHLHLFKHGCVGAW